MKAPLNNIPRKVYSVSQLTENIKLLLEDKFSMIWISGEISNLRVPASGHAYFTLKDDKAQISAVMFRGQLRQLKFDLDHGITLVGLGRITVYEPRGNYQIIIEYAEPQGIGALQIAFEQLKSKLLDEGLFAKDHKLNIAYLPRRIGVVTSPSGSVIKDILKVFKRRFFNLIVDVYPVRVQGDESPVEIEKAIALANRLNRNHVLILARGGGSLEDLAAFNSERVARAIYASSIPIVSAVGHETDYTIADFVSDLRAPTPSAAAEMVIPVKADLEARVFELKQRCMRAATERIRGYEQRLEQIMRRIIHPGKKIQDLQLHVDRLNERMSRAMMTVLETGKTRFSGMRAELEKNSPQQRLEILRSEVEVLTLKLLQTMLNTFANNSDRFKTAHAVLSAVNPTAVLERGYSITRTLPHRSVVMDAGELHGGQMLEVQFSKGKANVVVDQLFENKSHKE